MNVNIFSSIRFAALSFPTRQRRGVRGEEAFRLPYLRSYEMDWLTGYTGINYRLLFSLGLY